MAHGGEERVFGTIGFLGLFLRLKQRFFPLFARGYVLNSLLNLSPKHVHQNKSHALM